MVEKKSKKKKKVKQIPAKAGAKAKVGSGGKVEVVLNTVRTVKDASRGKYKPRKKTTKKQDASKKQKDAIQLLREQIELEKLQALQRQSIQPLQQAQRIPNRRTGGDINQFFKESKNTGKTEVISDLAKEVKSLREELKKKDEKPVEKEKPKEEEKSKFKQELETTQNEIQRQRIQRGIARRDEEQREKNLQAQIDRVEKQKKTEQSRLRVATRELRKEKTAREQAQRVSEEQFKRQESLDRARDNRKVLESFIQESKKREPPNTRPTVLKLREKPQRPLFLDDPVSKEKIFPKSKPEPEPEPTKERPRFKVGGEIEVPFSSQEELLQAFRNRPNQPKPLSPLPKESKKENIAKDLVGEIIGGAEERIEKRKTQVPSSGSVSVPDEEPLDIDIKEEPVFQEERKQRRESFLEQAQSPQVEEPVLIDKLKVEAEKLRELQESGDKAYQDRLEAEIQIQEDERVARDLLLEQKRREDFNRNTKELDESMRLLKEKKQREKKKARDNLRKREQEEFLDETAGEIIRGATEQAVGQRRETRREAGRQAVRNVFSNVLGGKELANEIVVATQKIPRSAGEDRYSQRKTQERIGDLIHSDYTKKVGRKAYTEEEAIKFQDDKKFANDLKEKLGLIFPFIQQKNYTKEMTAKKLQAQINKDMEFAKNSGKYNGKEIVQLKNLLDKLAQTLQDIKNIEEDKRDRRTGKNRPLTETEDERLLRIRQAERGVVEQLIQEEDEDLNQPPE